MTRSLFIKIIKLIQAQDKIDNKVSDALELISDSWIMLNGKNKKYHALNLLLADAMNDTEDDWIGWWLYEEVEKKIFFDKKLKRKPIELKTAGQLYDYLIEEYGKR